MGYEERVAVLSRRVKTVICGEDALMHNIQNGSWCRISSQAAHFFGKAGGVDLAREAASMRNGEAVSMLRLAAELADAGMLIEKGREEPDSLPRVGKAYLIVTRKCNLCCPDCYMGEAANEEYPLTTVRLAAGKLRAVKPRKIIVTGGEPCLREDLPDILMELKGTNGVLCTNGTMPDKVPYSLMRKLGIGLQVSVESCDSADHNAIRGNGCHELASETARRAASVGIETEIVPTISPASEIDIDSMMKFAGGLGTGCHASMLTGVGKGRIIMNIDGVEILKSIARYLLCCVERGEIDNAAELEDIAPMVSKMTCGAGTKVVACTGDGVMHPCHLMWDKPFEPALWKRDVDSNPVCSNCEVRYLCGGGCMAAAATNGGTDPNCGTYKEILRAFAWGWDDSRTVRENIGRILTDADKKHLDHISLN